MWRDETCWFSNEFRCPGFSWGQCDDIFPLRISRPGTSHRQGHALASQRLRSLGSSLFSTSGGSLVSIRRKSRRAEPRQIWPCFVENPSIFPARFDAKKRWIKNKPERWKTRKKKGKNVRRATISALRVFSRESLTPKRPFFNAFSSTNILQNLANLCTWIWVGADDFFSIIYDDYFPQIFDLQFRSKNLLVLYIYFFFQINKISFFLFVFVSLSSMHWFRKKESRPRCNILLHFLFVSALANYTVRCTSFVPEKPLFCALNSLRLLVITKRKQQLHPVSTIRTTVNSNISNFWICAKAV